MKGDYDTFIVRFQSPSRAQYRGLIQHIRSQEEAHFDTFQNMNEFIKKHLNLPFDPMIGTGASSKNKSIEKNS
jgi:hypothetical protein